MKSLFTIFIFFTGTIAFSQTCPNLISPLDGSTNVPVDTSINWDFVEGVTGHIISIGTSPEGTDIIDQRDVGSSATFTPPLGLPENKLIYVTITLLFSDQPNITCPSQTFSTQDVTTVPDCSALSNPLNTAGNVNRATNISWDYAPGATSYQLLVRTSLGGDIVNQYLGNVLSYTPLRDLPASTEFFVTIIPLNENGSAINCTEESFTTGVNATLPACDHTIYPISDFYKCDVDNDHFEEFNINLGELEASLIRDQTGLVITYHNAGGDLIDFSPGTQVVVNQRTIIARATNIDGCYKETSFKLTLLSPPTIGSLFDIVECESYTLPAIDNNSGYFTGLRGSGNQLRAGDIITTSQIIHVYAVQADCSDESSFNVTIDPSFCQEETVETNAVFPKFFTPNGDDINDLWKYESYPENHGIEMEFIEIYDRYGNFVMYLNQDNPEWDGNLNGNPQPSSDYWFKASLADGRIFKGHFALKR
ncbi:MAG: T9SS type B sorting domain-containing protein [Maribacter sp.]|nr:T9SS type B sorting domain-containing protein [Maribacter sp.]